MSDRERRSWEWEGGPTADDLQEGDTIGFGDVVVLRVTAKKNMPDGSIRLTVKALGEPAHENGEPLPEMGQPEFSQRPTWRERRRGH